MTSTDAATLAGDAVCIQSCVPDGLKVPALIVLLADLAGVSPDPHDLIENSVCINSCIPPGLQMSVLINLFAQIADITAPCVNVIPDGTTYFFFSNKYDLSALLTPNTTYQITFGANELSLDNADGTPTHLDAPGTWQFTTGPMNVLHPTLNSIIGDPGLPVTATICAI